MKSQADGIIDARSGRTRSAGYEESLVQDALKRTPFSAWLLASLFLLAVFLYLRQSWNARRAEERERLMYRRRAGIPDTDKRDFKVAYVDAEQRRLAARYLGARPTNTSVSRSHSVNGDLSLRDRSTTLQNLNNTAYTSTYRQPIPSTSRRSSVLPPSRDFSAMLPPPAPSPRQQYSPQPFSPSRLSHTAVYTESPRREVNTRKRSQAPSTVDADESANRHDDKRLRPATRSMATSVSPRPEVSASRKRKNSPTESVAPSQQDSPAQSKPRRKRQKPNDEGKVDMEVDESVRSSNKRKARSSGVPGAFDAPQSSDEDVAMDLDEESVSEKARSKRRRHVQESEDRKDTSDGVNASKSANTMKKADDQKTKILSKAKSRASTSRQPGDQWENLNGDRFRMTPEGVEERLVLVKELRPKYKMPKDSTHPDSKILEEVMVEKWVAERAFDSLRKTGQLAWQSKKSDIANGDDIVPETSSSPGKELSLRPVETEEGDIYFVRGSRVPLIAGSPKPSPKSSQAPVLLPNGRIRLSSSNSNRSLTPKRSLVSLMYDRGSGAKRKRQSIASVDSSFVETPDTSIIVNNSLIPATPLKEEEEKSATEISASAAPSETSAASTANVESAAPPSANPVASPFTFGPATSASGNEWTRVKAEPAREKPAFSFGAVKTEPADKPASPFSFASSSTSTTDVKPATAATPFSFAPVSQPSSDQAKSATSPFSFGTSANASSSIAAPKADHSEAPKPAFSFGQAADSAATQSKPAASPFAFGSAAPPPSNTAPASSSSNTGSPFSFGAKPPAPNAAAGAASPFSFGVANAEPAQASPSTFNFGGNPSQSTQPAATPAPAFNFGNASSSAPAPASAPGFQFGTSNSNIASPVPSFGNTAVPFSFGQPAAQQNQQSAPQNNAFTFGTPSPTPSPGIPTFNPGAAPPSTPRTPGGRTTRALPTRRRP